MRVHRALLVGVVGFSAHATSGHEVTVHHRMSREAVVRSVRMAEFTADFDISQLEPFPGAPVTVLRLLHDEMGRGSVREYQEDVKDWGWRPADLVRAGSITEDAGSRWCNHFFQPTSIASGAAYNIAGVPACGIDAVSWALAPIDPAAEPSSDEHSWHAAYNHLYRGITAVTPSERKQFLARSFYDLGHVIHLVQDLSQPSHTRNDGHACLSSLGHGLPCDAADLVGDIVCNAGPGGCSAFERFFHAKENRRLVDEIVGSTPSGTPWFGSSAGPYYPVANFSAGQFFSDETIRIIPEFVGVLPDYPPFLAPPEGSDPYVLNLNLGDGRDRVLRWIPLEIPDFPADPHWNPQSYADKLTIDDKDVLLACARNLYPVAVQNSAAMLDFFFRARLRLVIEQVDTSGPEFDVVTYSLQNISSVPAGAELAPFTLTELSKLQAFAEFDDETLSEEPLSIAIDPAIQFLAPGGAVTISVNYPRGPKVTPDRKTVLAYDGLIGAERGVVGVKSKQLGIKTELGVWGEWQVAHQQTGPTQLLTRLRYCPNKPVVQLIETYALGGFGSGDYGLEPACGFENEAEILGALNETIPLTTHGTNPCCPGYLATGNGILAVSHVVDSDGVAGTARRNAALSFQLGADGCIPCGVGDGVTWSGGFVSFSYSMSLSPGQSLSVACELTGQFAGSGAQRVFDAGVAVFSEFADGARASCDEVIAGVHFLRDDDRHPDWGNTPLIIPASASGAPSVEGQCSAMELRGEEGTYVLFLSYEQARSFAGAAEGGPVRLGVVVAIGMLEGVPNGPGTGWSTDESWTWSLEIIDQP